MTKTAFVTGATAGIEWSPSSGRGERSFYAAERPCLRGQGALKGCENELPAPVGPPDAAPIVGRGRMVFKGISF